MQITFTMHVPNPIMAAQQAKVLKSLLEGGIQDASGSGMEFLFWNLQTEDDVFDDGDYRDAAGNLLHVHTDHVVSAVMADKNATEVEPMMHVMAWEQVHGELVKVADDNHTHGHDHSHGQD